MNYYLMNKKMVRNAPSKTSIEHRDSVPEVDRSAPILNWIKTDIQQLTTDSSSNLQGGITVDLSKDILRPIKDVRWTRDREKGSAYVIFIQRLLNARLNTTLALDSQLGPKTNSALMQFQQKVKDEIGAPYAARVIVDGIIGPATINALLSDDSSYTELKAYFEGKSIVNDTPAAAADAAPAPAPAPAPAQSEDFIFSSDSYRDINEALINISDGCLVLNNSQINDFINYATTSPNDDKTRILQSIKEIEISDESNTFASQRFNNSQMGSFNMLLLVKTMTPNLRKITLNTSINSYNELGITPEVSSGNIFRGIELAIPSPTDALRREEIPNLGGITVTLGD